VNIDDVQKDIRECRRNVDACSNSLTVIVPPARPSLPAPRTTLKAQQMAEHNNSQARLGGTAVERKDKEKEKKEEIRDAYHEVMTEFLAEWVEKLEKVEAKFTELQVESKKFAKSFGEPETTKSEDIFRMINTFARDLLMSQQENDRRNRVEEKKSKKASRTKSQSSLMTNFRRADKSEKSEKSENSTPNMLPPSLNAKAVAFVSQLGEKLVLTPRTKRASERENRRRDGRLVALPASPRGTEKSPEDKPPPSPHIKRKTTRLKSFRLNRSRSNDLGVPEDEVADLSVPATLAAEAVDISRLRQSMTTAMDADAFLSMLNKTSEDVPTVIRRMSQAPSSTDLPVANHSS